MKGLLIKDLLNLRRNINTAIIMIILYFLFAFKSGDPSILVGMIVLFFTMMSITSLAYDDVAKWDKFAVAMPISRKKMVYSKYILSVILSFFGLVVSGSIGYIIILLKGKMSPLVFLITCYVIFFISILFNCILFPLVYKFGVEKSRLMMIGVIAIPMVLSFLVSEMGISMPSESQLKLLLWISPIILLISLFISLNISYNIFKKKDL